MSKIYSGMGLKEIQDAAGELCDAGINRWDSPMAKLALLIANLAARMQEQTVMAHIQEDCEQTIADNIKAGNIELDEMKMHQVTVQYRATVDINAQIEANISAAFRTDVMNIDYMRITSDRDGV